MEQQVLEKIHKVEQEILDEIDRICKEENISYFLVGGTLLGAIRHKGFIPWDDDLDIGMPRKDFERFIDVCGEKLNEKFVLHWYNTDDDYYLTFAKIRRTNTCYIEKDAPQNPKYSGLWVDIFPLDYSDGKEKKTEQIKCKFLYKLRGYLIALRNGKEQTGGSKKLKFTVSMMNMLNISNKFFLKIYCMVAGRKKAGKFLMNYGSQYGIKKQMILADKYFPPKRIEFEGKFYCAPQDPDYVLTQIYGKDYMKLPPIEKRTTHNPLVISFDCDNNEI